MAKNKTAESAQPSNQLSPDPFSLLEGAVITSQKAIVQ
jgi:hypothetical protein